MLYAVDQVNKQLIVEIGFDGAVAFSGMDGLNFEYVEHCATRDQLSLVISRVGCLCLEGAYGAE